MDRLLYAISRSWPLKILAYVLAWTVPGLISATQLLLSYSLRGDSAPMSLLVRITFPTWYAWALLAPVIWMAARRFPLDGSGWLRALPVHLLLNGLLLLASAALVLGARRLFSIPTSGSVTAALIGGINTSLLAYWTIVLLSHAARYYTEGRARALRESELAAQLSEARLDALRAQLHPHFLFNTMHAISAFLREDPDKAEAMLAELAELLRMALEGDGEHLVPLSREIDFMERYLSIQKARLGERLTLEMDLSRDAGDAVVPAMLLQPLLENAVEHGVARRRAPGRVRVRIAREGERLRLEVADDGPGIAPEDRDPSRWRVGLRNTRERLAQLYGDDHAFELADLSPHGLLVRVDIPLRSAVEVGP
ncbi:MAG TPA: histidine kinase [Longimicrobiales bacterium]|jgi:signal transduction histidine kinase